MPGVRWKKIAIAGAQGVALGVNRQFERAADDPVRLILSMRVCAVDCSRRVAPFKDTVAFALQTLAECLGDGLIRFIPPFNSQAHSLSTVVDKLRRSDIFIEPLVKHAGAPLGASYSAPLGL